MSNIVIEKSPVGMKLDYSECVVFEKGKLAQGLKKLKNMYFNEKQETYGPFEGEDAISFLEILDYEDKLS